MSECDPKDKCCKLRCPPQGCEWTLIGDSDKDDPHDFIFMPDSWKSFGDKLGGCAIKETKSACPSECFVDCKTDDFFRTWKPKTDSIAEPRNKNVMCHANDKLVARTKPKDDNDETDISKQMHRAFITLIILMVLNTGMLLLSFVVKGT